MIRRFTPHKNLLFRKFNGIGLFPICTNQLKFCSHNNNNNIMFRQFIPYGNLVFRKSNEIGSVPVCTNQLKFCSHNNNDNCFVACCNKPFRTIIRDAVVLFVMGWLLCGIFGCCVMLCIGILVSLDNDNPIPLIITLFIICIIVSASA